MEPPALQKGSKLGRRGLRCLPRRAPGRQEEERGRRRNEAWLKIAGEKFLSSCLEGKSRPGGRSPAPRLALSGVSDTFWALSLVFLEDRRGCWPPVLQEIVPTLPKLNNLLVSRSGFDTKHRVPGWELSFPSPAGDAQHQELALCALQQLASPREDSLGDLGRFGPKREPGAGEGGEFGGDG